MSARPHPQRIPPAALPRPSAMSGVSLVEVMVAMLLLGSGALALLGLQLQALRTARDGLLRSQAVMMAAELAELRAQSGAQEDDPYLLRFDASTAPVGASDCHSRSCTPHEFASAASADWQQRLAATLPGARAVVCRDARPQAGDQWPCDDQPDSPVLAKFGWQGAGPTNAPALTVFIGH